MVERSFERGRNLINNHTILLDVHGKGDIVTPYMDVYKAKIQSDRSIDKLNLIIEVRGDFQNKENIGDTWAPT